MIMSSSSVTTSMVESASSGFILAGFMASKNADLLYFGRIISVTVKRLVTSHIIS